MPGLGEDRQARAGNRPVQYLTGRDRHEAIVAPPDDQRGRGHLVQPRRIIRLPGLEMREGGPERPRLAPILAQAVGPFDDVRRDEAPVPDHAAEELAEGAPAQEMIAQSEEKPG